MSKTLILPRVVWESDVTIKNGYSFTKKELDDAEKLDIKLIGTVNGVMCYLPPKIEKP